MISLGIVFLSLLFVCLIIYRTGKLKNNKILTDLGFRGSIVSCILLIVKAVI